MIGLKPISVSNVCPYQTVRMLKILFLLEGIILVLNYEKML